MQKGVIGFLTGVLLYHVIVTVFSFGLGWVPPVGILMVRDAGWLLAIAVMALQCRDVYAEWAHRWSVPLLLALMLLVVAIGTSIALDVDVRHMFVGIKYTLYYLVPFFTAMFVGNVWVDVLTRHADFSPRTVGRALDAWMLQIFRLVIVVLIVGWIWQGAKVLLPNLFVHIGYGPLGDYIFGAKPPIYYLTGPGGLIRRSGIFSGPNNYGYFLVASFGLYRYGVQHYLKRRTQKVRAWLLFVLTLLATMSRGAILGVLVQVVLISYVAYNAQRRIVLAAVLLGVCSVVGLSALKWQSTVAHLQAKLGSLAYVQSAPFGYGLGSSGPSALSQGGVVPENHFIQIMMDLGLHGFVMWAALWLIIIMMIRRVYVRAGNRRSWVFFLTVGFVGLMVEGLFLHVLEDSMVNYWYFILWGIVVGVADAQYHALVERR